MIEIFTGLKRITNQAELDVVYRLAARDGHDVIHPTHVIVQNRETVGYVSVGEVPTTLCHFSQDMKAEDSFNIINLVENIIYDRGGRTVLTPVGLISPFHPVLSNPKVGYRKLANVDLFLKELK